MDLSLIYPEYMKGSLITEYMNENSFRTLNGYGFYAGRKYEKMAAGVGGLQTALILIGFIIRFQPNFNNNIEVYDVRPENLGFYACQLDIKESKFDYTIQKLCSGLLDTSNQNGRPEKSITENRKIANPSTYCLILSILLSGDIHIKPGPIKYACTLSSMSEVGEIKSEGHPQALV